MFQLKSLPGFQFLVPYLLLFILSHFRTQGFYPQKIFPIPAEERTSFSNCSHLKSGLIVENASEVSSRYHFFRKIYLVSKLAISSRSPSAFILGDRKIFAYRYDSNTSKQNSNDLGFRLGITLSDVSSSSAHSLPAYISCIISAT